jgi:hypothetical protein
MPLALESFCTPLEQATGPMPFLYQAGYLTIKDYDKSEDLYVLGVPNTEVRVGLLKNLIPLYSAMNPDEALRQIEEKHYDAPYLTDGREIVKLGVNFSKETRTLESWRRGE